jgi:uncharacterized protein
VDILVELPKGSSLLDLIHIQLQLEDELGKKVDLITFKGIKPRVKPYIDKDQIYIL